MNKLAILGGETSVPVNLRKVEWPLITEADEQAVFRALKSGKLTAMAAGEEEVSGLEQEWADYIGAKHCVAVSNGTTALHLALSALDLQPGDEVLVPALSFIASAIAPLYHLLIPVFVDIDPITFNMDIEDLKAKISKRSKAVIVVHLHGLPAEMDEIMQLSKQFQLKVIEDAAQAHGAQYKGKFVGTIGHIGTFSLNVSKNLPTCGEGGLVTTNDPHLYDSMLMNRQFGERVEPGKKREYVHQTLGWNYKLSSIQAAFTRSQLQRFDHDQQQRHDNVTSFLNRIAALPGMIVPGHQPDRTHSWHILRIRFDPAAAGLYELSPGQFRIVLKKALLAEGVPLSEYQQVPLQGHQVFQEKKGYGQSYPWALSSQPYNYDIYDTPHTLQVIEDSLTLQKMHLNPQSAPLLQCYAEAFEKVLAQLELLQDIGKNIPNIPPWQKFVKTEISEVY
ncbi:DegT/DnrJ/EryC1/StrS family aminotransferase [Paenibacillus campi]|uniref:DegT/DnrJ/EryC1/StrS family aminotransferase n=1 Tax=Paenibacillus campi TaxID=3106031 RepID=UPI002AFE7850|nr:DegT/DnrJ/EryC1/StrS family aminotransferase [Paenibacillus sp. SGZ-1014]